MQSIIGFMYESRRSRDEDAPSASKREWKEEKEQEEREEASETFERAMTRT